MSEYFPDIIKERFNEKILEDCSESRIPETLYHYTNSRGLQGIMESNSLHLTRVDCCNDPSERLLAYELLQERIKARIENNSLSSSSLSELSARVIGPSQFGSELFIFCMSEECDDLTQWRSYCSTTDGYCMGFNWRGIPFVRDQKYLGEQSEYRITIKRVIYREDEQIRLIDWYLDLYEESARRFANETHRPARSGWGYFDQCHMYFQTVAAFIKSHHYKSEREWRIVRYIDHGYYPPMERDRELRFKSGRLGITPFVAIDTPFRSEYSRRLPIRSVRQSPRYEPNVGLNALRAFIYHNEFSDCDSMASSVPARW